MKKDDQEITLLDDISNEDQKYRQQVKTTRHKYSYLNRVRLEKKRI